MQRPDGCVQGDRVACSRIADQGVTDVSKPRRSSVVLGAVFGLLLVGSIAVAATPVKVLGTARNEIDPTAEFRNFA